MPPIYHRNARTIQFNRKLSKRPQTLQEPLFPHLRLGPDVEILYKMDIYNNAAYSQSVLKSRAGQGQDEDTPFFGNVIVL